MDPLTREEQRLLASLHRWARGAGWMPSRLGRTSPDGNLAVGAEPGELLIWRRGESTGLWQTWSAAYPVASVRQAIDVLYALGIVPREFCSAALTAGDLTGPPRPDVADRAQAAAEQLPTVGRWPGADATPGDLDALQALAALATETPWSVYDYSEIVGPSGQWVAEPLDIDRPAKSRANAAYIVAAANAVPALIAELRRWRATGDGA